MLAHQLFMQKAIDLAVLAREKGNHPFGALLVLGGEVVLTAVNKANTEHDVTSHAELNLVSLATQQFAPETLTEMVLYTSTEPCAMCAGSIYWAGIRTVVYGCSAESLGEIAGGSFVIPCRDIFARGQEETVVVGPLMEETAVKVHHGFWDTNQP